MQRGPIELNKNEFCITYINVPRFSGVFFHQKLRTDTLGRKSKKPLKSNENSNNILT